LGEAPGVILPRLHFDEHLFRRACTATGIHVIEGTTAKTFTRTANGMDHRHHHGTRARRIHFTCKIDHRCQRRQLRLRTQRGRTCTWNHGITRLACGRITAG
jgi:hypothetical protein